MPINPSPLLPDISGVVSLRIPNISGAKKGNHGSAQWQFFVLLQQMRQLLAVVDVFGSFFLLLGLLPSAGRLKSSIDECDVILCLEPAAGFRNPMMLSSFLNAAY